MASGSFYDDPDAVDAYLAHRHRPVFSPNEVMEAPAIAELVGDVAGLRIIDLGCGDAAFGAECENGHCESYVGVEASAAMRERAAAACSDVVRVIDGDLNRWRGLPASADLVVSRMALHYVDDLGRLLNAIALTLTPGGRLVFSVVHPAITAARTASPGPRQSIEVDDYFDQSARDREWFDRKVRWRHRTIEGYVSAVLAAGLHIDALTECEPQEERFQGDVDEFRRRRRVPLFLAIAAAKPALQG